MKSMDAHLINLLMSAMLTALRRGWITLYVVFFFRWEDGNNLTSNLFTLISNTGLLQHTKKIHQTYMHTHINLTQKKKREEK